MKGLRHAAKSLTLHDFKMRGLQVPSFPLLSINNHTSNEDMTLFLFSYNTGILS